MYIEELIIADKQDYLNNNFIFQEIPKLTDKIFCIHCEQVLLVGNYKVYKNEEGFEFICCPNAPDCNGTIIDWFPPD